MMSKENYQIAYMMCVDECGQQYQGYLFEVENLQEYKKLCADGLMEKLELENDIIVMCEPEAVVRGLPLNRAVYDENGKFITILAGNIVVLKCRNRKFIHMSQEDIVWINQHLKPIVRIFNGKIYTKSVCELPIWEEL